MPDASTPPMLHAAIEARAHLVDEEHRTAFRLFNGHLEGDPRYVIDVYGKTAVVFHHGPATAPGVDLRGVIDVVRAAVPWLDAVVVKERQGASHDERRGRIAWRRPGGSGVDTSIVEGGVRYAVDLLANHDAGFYLDTRHLRRWLFDGAAGKTVLNTFAYTGSLGVAAGVGGAERVLHTDLSVRALEVAQASTALNGLRVERKDFQVQDFFSIARGLKLRGERFDIVVLDPPFFSTTRGGSLDLSLDTPRLINKVRPLVRGGGKLVVVNNALFLSGEAFMAELEALCSGGWMTLEERIAVPQDVTGYPETRVGAPPVDPSPFDHATKIVVLGVRHRG
jgi:23S rRNA (cytosine1962-C5)-methyltransferase